MMAPNSHHRPSNHGPASEDLSDLAFLVVDDMASMRRMLRSMLTNLGVRRFIGEAGDGKEAWDKLSTMSYDCIICDINMPRMNGLEFLKLVRDSENLKHIPVLMITGEVSEDVVASAAESEVDHYLLKPFQLRALETRLKQVIHKKKHPSQGEIIFQRAKTFQQAGQFTASLQEGLRLCQPPFVRQAKVLNLVGECYLELGELEKAQTFLSEAMALNPRYLKTYRNYAIFQEKSGNPEDAIQILQLANQLNPRNSDRLIQLGRLLLQTNHPEEAQGCFDKAIDCQPNTSQNLKKEIAEILLAGGLAAEAETYFIQSIQNDPGNLHLYNRLGVALRQQKKHQEALKWYKKALTINPEHDVTHYNLGILYIDLGRRDQAKEALATALRLHPDFPEAQNLYNRLFSA